MIKEITHATWRNKKSLIHLAWQQTRGAELKHIYIGRLDQLKTKQNG
jgi:hypothetical protein